MLTPSLHFVTCPDPQGGDAGHPQGAHRVAYWQWGDPTSSHVVVCAHGLTRQGRDFDILAKAICEQAEGHVRVVCTDVVGRGQSDWLKDPMGYQLPTYIADMVVLLAHLQQQAAILTLDWVGTSMGGLIGMGIAGFPGLPLPAPVRRMVLNDVGPAIQWQAIQRIGSYVGQSGQFPSVQAAADAMWAISTSFGPHTPEQWLELSRHMVKPVTGDINDAVTLHYDPAMALPFKTLTQESAQAGEAQLWQLYDGITAKVLLLRGAVSDLLSHATALEMAQRGPKATLLEFQGVGHAPTLIAPHQTSAVVHWLFDGLE